MRMRAIGLVVLLIMVGCTSPEPGPPTTPTPTAVEYPQVEPPKDRDERAVIAALRQLDACALLDPIGGSKPAATGPHRCAVKGDDHIRVTLGVRFDRGHRYRTVPLDLGGAKAYLDPAQPAADSCLVAIPVSFALTVTVEGRKGPRSRTGDICAPTKSAAAIAATRLANPPPGSATRWAACQLLGEIAGDAVLEIDIYFGLDRCRASERSPDGPGSTLFDIYLEYGDDPTEGATDVRTIAGQRVAVKSNKTVCSFLWGMVRLHTTIGCAQGESLVPKLITALASPNPDRTSPQRPLPIRSDEPDLPLVGACVDYPYGDNCQPSGDMPVPEDAQAALATAAADARVACALAKDSIRTHLGPALTPVLGGLSSGRPHCYFVEPGHTIIVEVFIQPDDDLTGDIVASGGRDLTVATRPAKLVTNTNYSQLCLLPVSGAKTGLLCLMAQFFHGRGKEPTAPADTSKAAQLEPAVTEIVTRHFS